MKQNVTLRNAQVSHLINTWGIPGTEKAWNCCCHPKIFAQYPFLPLTLFSIAPGSAPSWETVTVMFFTPEYKESDDEMPQRCHSYELVFWWGHPRVGAFLGDETEEELSLDYIWLVCMLLFWEKAKCIVERCIQLREAPLEHNVFHWWTTGARFIPSFVRTVTFHISLIGGSITCLSI